MDEGDGRDQMDQFHQNEAISAVADDGFMAEEEDDDYEDLYNDVNVGEGFLQSVKKSDEAGSRNDEEKEKVGIDGEDRVEPVLGTPEAEVSIPGLVGESLVKEGEAGAGGSGGTDVVVASSGYGAQEVKVSDVSQEIPDGIGAGTGGGLRVELGPAANRPTDLEVPRGNNISQGLLPPPPHVLGNNENLMRPVMGHVNGGTPPGPGMNMVGNGGNIAMPGVVGGGTGGGGNGTFLFVGDLHWWTTDAELEAELCKYGAVKEVKFFDEKASGKSKGYCQVEFYDPMAATACKDGLNGYAFNGRPCVVEYASPYSVKRMGEAQVNRTQQAQSVIAQAKRGGPADPPSKPVVANNNAAIGGNFQGGGNRGFGRGNWGRGNAPGGRGPGGPMRNRPNGMGRGLMGNGAFGQGMGTGPPMNMMHQPMMGQGFEQAFGGPMARMGGYGGFPGAPGPPFPGLLSSFPPVGGVGLPGVAPHVNPAFFGRGMPMNGMGMMLNAGVDGGHNMGMWDPNSGGWASGEDLGGGRAAESSYGEEAASDHQYGEVNHDRGRPNPVKDKERASEREWSGSSDRRIREDKDAGYERDIPREKDVGHGYEMPERRHRDDRDTGREREREHHHKDRERSKDRERERDRDRERDRERDRHREGSSQRYGGDHRTRHRDEPEHDDEWNRGRSSRGHSKSRLSREDNHRSRSRDADYGKRRRLTTE
ncbi:PREDICTED: cleavage and polyadenylation specificity factor subunit 6-like [Camelina sativa]|uniref:Cleavage and polyadenylation specificity factor subunit 6-like n=1 Tax=Camelina sativa TaxID=90675 RepID=A0ABM0UM85_CAMSA|nr:PREDICTED: cleavage and polyadenylation specificity factor subunit 6-like [Camelina sativa]